MQRNRDPYRVLYDKNLNAKRVDIRAFLPQELEASGFKCTDTPRLYEHRRNPEGMEDFIPIDDLDTLVRRFKTFRPKDSMTCTIAVGPMSWRKSSVPRQIHSDHNGLVFRLHGDGAIEGLFARGILNGKKDTKIPDTDQFARVHADARERIESALRDLIKVGMERRKRGRR